MKDLTPILKTLWKSKTGPFLLVIQIAVAFTILINVGHMAINKWHEINKPSGLDEAHLFTFTANLPVEPDSYQARLEQDFADILELASVESVNATNSVPLTSWGLGLALNRTESDESYISYAGVYSMSSNFVETLGLEVIMGRKFDDAEMRLSSDDYMIKSTTAMVTKALAEKISPEDWTQTVGKTIYINGRPYQIVGIVNELIATWPAWWGNKRSIIFPVLTLTNESKFMVRAHPGQLQQAMEEVHTLLMRQPGRIIDKYHPFSHTRETGYKPMISSLVILIAVTIGLMVVTMLGTFGQARFAILRRKRQIGIRRALGASKWQIVRYYILENMVITSFGILLGVICAILLNVKLMDFFDLLSVPGEYFLVGAAVILVAGQFAVIPPALSAANISPASATRSV
ncbi:ABC transporter permease [Pseudoalteromonas sp. SMS1]|uniref:ABC transporter permease n=1 Tax=Pseudoalteromonas sp. SMS1 TaxID=2908894 RepID=UPI001F2FFCFD|nr:ABC transporter permease [Pseudoalteromonas sp. SMS1]MCF2856431.1 ABC transporter permease [Pseudoalteromonas sp. SMS1]